MAENEGKPIQANIEISVSFEDDFRRLREMLNKIEKLKELVPDWNETEADRIHDEILQLARETISANANRRKDVT